MSRRAPWIDIELIIPFINRFLHWTAVGIGTTVMSLLMLSKGSSVSTLGLITAIYSIFIIVFEFPSGILSDLIGQKTIYLCSVALSILGYATVLFTNSLSWLFVGFSFYGIARAFSSGSVEALFISSYLQRHGKEKLHRLMSILNSGEVIGLASGALLGGIIPTLWERAFPLQNKYSGNLIIQVAILIIQLIFTSISVVDPPRERREKPSLLAHMRASFDIVKRSRNLRLLIAGTAVWGFCFNSLELYWQPRLKNILGSDSNTLIFGIINSGYFLASLVGVILINLVLSKRRLSQPLIIVFARLATGTLFVALSFQAALIPFSAIYLALFMVNGMMNIPEGTLLNATIPDEMRSSLLSFASLMTQLGGVLGSLLFSLIVARLQIGGVWLLAGAAFALSAILYLIMDRKRA